MSAWHDLARRGHDMVRQEFAVLLAMLAAVSGTWAFFAVADEVLEAEHRPLDVWLLTALREPDQPEQLVGPAWLEQSALAVTALGSYTVLILAILAVSGFLLLARARTQLAMVLVAAFGGLLLSHGIKMLIGRPRPDEVLHLTTVTTASFPSGHAMNAAVVYLTLGAMLARLVRLRRLKVFVLGVAVVLTVLVGLTRVYLGVHYPSDVLAGWAAGLAWAAAVWLAMELISRSRRRAGRIPWPGR